jgi:hypothetical protein
MFDGAVRRALLALRHCKSPVHTGVQCHLFSRQSFMVAVRGSTHCIECDLSAGDLVQLPPSASILQSPSSAIEGRSQSPKIASNPSPLPKKHVVAAVNVGKFPKAFVTVLFTS